MTKLVNAATGEVTADPEAIRSAALDYVWLAEEIQNAEAGLNHARKRFADMGADLLLVIQEGQALDVGPAMVVRTPPPRPAQRVSRSGCEAYSEELLGLGLGRVEYAPPGITEVRHNAARIIAAGIDLERIAPTPTPGPDRLEIVAKDEA